jgi:hypothetical protein
VFISPVLRVRERLITMRCVSQIGKCRHPKMESLRR